MSSEASITEEVRKKYMKSFFFQRRILAGCTLSLLFGLILWIVAMTTDHWFIVTSGRGIFVESHKRYFKSSRSGIWKNCRHALLPRPYPIAISTVARNFSTLIAVAGDTNVLKKRVAEEEYIQGFMKIELPEVIEEIDEKFREKLFATWVKNDKLFATLKETYKTLDTYEIPEKLKLQFIDPTQLDTVASIVGENMVAITFNKTLVHLIVPQPVRSAIFKTWHEHGDETIRLLPTFARDMDINAGLNVGDSRIVIQPPYRSTAQRKKYNGFKYELTDKCTAFILFANVDAKTKTDPLMDEDMKDYYETAASFSILALFVMFLGFFFTVYTFLNPRYMFKRLAGGIHFISGLASATVCRVLHLAIQHAQDELVYAFPKGAYYRYGYGFYFGVLVSAINFFSFIMFLFYSKKRKGAKAISEELGMVDESVQIGR